MFLPVTMGTAAVLSVMFVVLSALVTVQRVRSSTSLGEGAQTGEGPSPLLVAIRRHGHFAEFVPFSLILIGLLEASGAHRPLLLGLAGALVLARILLVVGINARGVNPMRQTGNVLQWSLILVAGLSGGWMALTHG